MGTWKGGAHAEGGEEFNKEELNDVQTLKKSSGRNSYSEKKVLRGGPSENRGESLRRNPMGSKK